MQKNCRKTKVFGRVRYILEEQRTTALRKNKFEKQQLIPNTKVLREVKRRLLKKIFKKVFKKRRLKKIHEFTIKQKKKILKNLKKQRLKRFETIRKNKH